VDSRVALHESRTLHGGALGSLNLDWQVARRAAPRCSQPAGPPSRRDALRSSVQWPCSKA